MPCADDISTSKDDNISYVKHTQQQGDHEDNCSPFCHCTCCAGFTINDFINYSSVIKIISSNTKSNYLPSDIIEVILPIWQPPQLA